MPSRVCADHCSSMKLVGRKVWIFFPCWHVCWSSLWYDFNFYLVSVFFILFSSWLFGQTLQRAGIVRIMQALAHQIHRDDVGAVRLLRFVARGDGNGVLEALALAPGAHRITEAFHFVFCHSRVLQILLWFLTFSNTCYRLAAPLLGQHSECWPITMLQSRKIFLSSFTAIASWFLAIH